jgi:hypothetical protein
MRRFRKASWLGEVAKLRPVGRAPATWHERHSLQQNENGLLDTCRAGPFFRSSSGVPVWLTGQEGIRFAAPLRRQGKSGAAPATVGGEPSLTCHWALIRKVWEGGEER